MVVCILLEKWLRHECVPCICRKKRRLINYQWIMMCDWSGVCSRRGSRERKEPKRWKATTQKCVRQSNGKAYLDEVLKLGLWKYYERLPAWLCGDHLSRNLIIPVFPDLVKTHIQSKADLFFVGVGLKKTITLLNLFKLQSSYCNNKTTSLQVSIRPLCSLLILFETHINTRTDTHTTLWPS